MVDLQATGRYSVTYSCSNARGIQASTVRKIIDVVPFDGSCACDNSCPFANDGHCMDAGPGSLGAGMALCSVGTDCADCGPSNRTALMPGSNCRAWRNITTLPSRRWVPHAVRHIVVEPGPICFKVAWEPPSMPAATRYELAYTMNRRRVIVSDRLHTPSGRVCLDAKNYTPVDSKHMYTFAVRSANFAGWGAWSNETKAYHLQGEPPA